MKTCLHCNRNWESKYRVCPECCHALPSEYSSEDADDGVFAKPEAPAFDPVNAGIKYWNGLPVIHDTITKRYLVVFTEQQFEDLLKAQEEK